MAANGRQLHVSATKPARLPAMVCSLAGGSTQSQGSLPHWHPCIAAYMQAAGLPPATNHRLMPCNLPVVQAAQQLREALAAAPSSKATPHIIGRSKWVMLRAACWAVALLHLGVWPCSCLAVCICCRSC